MTELGGNQAHLVPPTTRQRGGQQTLNAAISRNNTAGVDVGEIARGGHAWDCGNAGQKLPSGQV